MIKQICFTSITGLVLYAITLNGMYIHRLYIHISPMDYLSGLMDRDTYISQFRREHPVIQYANKTSPEDAKLLCLSIGNRTYYIDRQVHFAKNFYKKTRSLFRKSSS